MVVKNAVSLLNLSKCFLIGNQLNINFSLSLMNFPCIICKKMCLCNKKINCIYSKYDFWTFSSFNYIILFFKIIITLKWLKWLGQQEVTTESFLIYIIHCLKWNWRIPHSVQLWHLLISFLFTNDIAPYSLNFCF